ncbi:helix-turn-helix domain-containing protein [uncultured Adlercreutzia sp.]|uniref:helix-turn-helix domain-containing protein n=1 Tax=uncultured Adlercreutzia sp. TaxID=875803 RepID=UPI0025CB8366|nr:helix-turn-helix transcriptional regulator [uncultured Adlercreutzia sp.]MCI9261283.1 helix-turn-helix transcriptional regulator [Eggerthellaceae bacterium]
MEKTAIRNKVGMRVKALRREQGITQEKFALMTGINRSYLADIEKGNRNFGFDTLERIVTGFGITYAEFFADIEAQG